MHTPTRRRALTCWSRLSAEKSEISLNVTRLGKRQFFLSTRRVSIYNQASATLSPRIHVKDLSPVDSTLLSGKTREMKDKDEIKG